MRTRAYRNYLLLVLSSIAALDIGERMGLGLVLQGIKADLHINDTELGLLTGIASACAQSVLGIPIARWADRGNRVRVIIFTGAVWSAMVALTGSVATFGQLFLTRVGVGIGDAGISPAAQSLIPDYFTRAERPKATAIYSLSWPVSLMLGYFVAGWVNEIYGWRRMFLFLGLAGLLMTAVAGFTLREPRLVDSLKRGAERNLNSFDPHWARGVSAVRPSHPNLREVLVALWTNVTFRHLLMSYSITSLFGMGILQWEPTFFIRSYEMSTAQVGNWFAVAMGLCTLPSIYSGGALMSRYAANNERLQLKLLAVGNLIFGITNSFLFLSGNRYLAIVLLGIGSALSSAASAPVLATVQTLIPPRMRATSIVILFLVANLIGMGIGPLLAGMLSDALRQMLGAESLRVALLSLCPGYAWGAWHMWRASETVRGDLERLPNNDDSSEAEVRVV